MIWTYENVRRALNGDDERTFPNLAATRFVRGADGVFHLEYHGSRIVTYHPDGTYTLDTCGYKTRTTKARLRKFGPLNIRSKNGRWILNSQGGDLEFFDGIRVDYWGKVEVDEDDDRYATEMTVDNQIGKMYP